MDPSIRMRRGSVYQDGSLQGGEPLLCNGGECEGPNQFSNSSTNVSNQVMWIGVNTTVAIANANVVPTLNAPHPSSLIHGGHVFPNIFNSIITNQASLPMMQDLHHPRTDGNFHEQQNQRLDELTNQFRQMQTNFTTNQGREVPQEKRVPVCYSCGVEGHIATRCPSRRKGGFG